MMKVVRLDIEKKEFEIEGGTVYPILFDIDESIPVEDFQKILDESNDIVKDLIGLNE